MYLRCPSLYFKANGTAQCPIESAEKAGYQETGFHVTYYSYSVGSQFYQGVLLQNYREETSNVIDSGSASAMVFFSLLIWIFIFRFFGD